MRVRLTGFSALVALLAAVMVAFPATPAVPSATSATVTLSGGGGEASSQTAGETLLIRGGSMFDSVGDVRRRNPGIVVRAGRIFSIGPTDEELAALGDFEVVDLTDGVTLLPGFFDLHAHHAIDLFGNGRIDEVEYYPLIFLANGVTSVFPAGEMDPDNVMAARIAIDNGERPGPRIMNSGPYFGSARPGWNRDATPDQIREEVDYWVAQGAMGFKAKGIGPVHLRALIEQAHVHGLPVTGHLDSGARNSVNPRDAIMMGIDRIEHFMGGDGMPATRSAYASLVELEPDTLEFRRIAALYIRHRVNFDATLSAYGYYGERDPEVYTYWVDEKSFLTPFARQHVEAQERSVNESFERIYWVKRTLLKAFYDAGGGHLITLGTDHPSWGEYLSGFAVHRELHSFVLSGIPPADAIKFATINGARAMRVSDQLGTIEVGKLADLVVVEGDPLVDIRATRDVRMVVRSGRVYDPADLLAAARGKIGPTGPEQVADWGRR